MPNRSQRNTKTFPMIKAEGQIKTEDYGKSSCIVEISAEGKTLTVGNAEVRFYIPTEEMQKALALIGKAKQGI